jgi:hypothetical protein
LAVLLVTSRDKLRGIKPFHMNKKPGMERKYRGGNHEEK